MSKNNRKVKYLTFKDGKRMAFHLRDFDRDWYEAFLVYAKSNVQVLRAETVRTYWGHFKTFIRFVMARKIALLSVGPIDLVSYIDDLAKNTNLREGQKAATFLTVVSVIKSIQTFEGYSHFKIIKIPPNPFARLKSDKAQIYTKEQVKRLVDAVSNDIHNFGFESFLRPPDLFWKGKPQPAKRRGRWAYVTYCIWYWETELDCGNALIDGEKCKCKKYNHFISGLCVSKFNGISDFFQSTGANSDSYKRKFDKHPPRVVERINRGIETLLWYDANQAKWELLNRIIPEVNLRIKDGGPLGIRYSERSFGNRVHKALGVNIAEFIFSLGIPYLISSAHIAPLLIVLHLETGWNAQPILDLKYDCLKPSQNLNLKDHYVLKSYKNRSDKHIRKTIRGDSSIVTIITILRNIRDRYVDLFPSIRMNNQEKIVLVYDQTSKQCATPASFSLSFRNFAKRHDFDFPIHTRMTRNTNLVNLSMKSNGSVTVVKEAAGHSDALTTLRYLRNVTQHNDFHSKIGREINQMVRETTIDLTEQDRVKMLMDKIGCSEGEADVMLQTREYPMMFFKCANPFKPPHDDSEPICHNFHNIYKCLSCHSLRLVEEDLYDYFSLVHWRKEGHDAKVHHSEIYDPIFEPLVEHIDEKLETKFPKETLERYRQLAQDKPLHGRKN